MEDIRKWVNLTEMCKKHGRAIEVFLKNKRVKHHIELLEAKLEKKVIQKKNGMYGGTWGHPLIALELQRWLDPEFTLECDLNLTKYYNVQKIVNDYDKMKKSKKKNKSS